MRILHDINSLPTFKNAVMTIGSFDGVHSAHQDILSKINQLAQEIDGESVVVTFHPHPREIIYPKDNTLQLLTDLQEKLDLLEKYGVQNVVVVPFSVEFSQQNPKEYIEKFLIGKFNPSYVVIGYDHRFGLNRGGNFTMLQEYEAEGHFKLLEIKKQELDDIVISSTKIRNALLEGDVTLASGLLNHSYALSGKVVHGKQIGKKIGFPTANIKLHQPKKLIPKEGVYAVRVMIEDSVFQGMMHIGNRPSIADDNKLSIEVHIFDFNQIIYNQDIKVKVLAFVRPNKKFDDLDQLTVQLTQDELDTRAILLNSKKLATTPKVAVAILNYNGQELLESFLPSVLYSSTEDCTIYVIDNGSTDDSLEYLTEWHPEVVQIALTKNYGFAEGYNKGMASIKEPYVAILNSDVRVAPSWLDPIVKVLDASPQTAVCQAKILSEEFNTHFEYAGAAGGMLDYLSYPFCRGRIFDTVEKDEGQYDTKQQIFWASGAAMVVRNDVFVQAGGFDKDFFAHQEEIDFCWRIQHLGFDVAYVPESVVYHLGGATLDYENPKKTYLNFRNNLTMMLKNDYSSSLWLKFAARLILDGVAGIKFLVGGKPKSTLAIIKAHLSVYGGMPKILQKRKTLKRLIQLKRREIPQTTFYNKSILWQYFVKGNKVYNQLEQ